jgi:hypothetical protein
MRHGKSNLLNIIISGENGARYMGCGDVKRIGLAQNYGFYDYIGSTAIINFLLS